MRRYESLAHRTSTLICILEQISNSTSWYVEISIYNSPILEQDTGNVQQEEDQKLIRQLVVAMSADPGQIVEQNRSFVEMFRCWIEIS